MASGAMDQVAFNVCEKQGHKIDRLHMTVDDHGSTIQKPIDMCTQCGMTLSEIRGEK